MDTKNDKHNQNNTENMLMFIGIALMGAGPVFFLVMKMAIDSRQYPLSTEMVCILEIAELFGALFLAVTGAMIALSGYFLAAMNAWRDIKAPEAIQ